MPLYDFHCIPCHYRFEKLVKYEDRYMVPCNKCGGETKPIISLGSYTTFHKGYYEHLAADPIYIESKQQLAEACDENGKYSGYLDDM